MPKREKFTNLEYRPFKALVVGSSPTQPKNLVRLRKPAELLWKPVGGRWSTVYLEISFSYQLLFVAIFRAAFGQFGPSDRSLVYFSVLYDLFGRFRRRSLEASAPS
jgi:hypothetical protein